MKLLSKPRRQPNFSLQTHARGLTHICIYCIMNEMRDKIAIQDTQFCCNNVVMIFNNRARNLKYLYRGSFT
jgi:hypothetical protein